MSNDLPSCFIDVLLPLPLPGYFTYRVPRDLAAHVGLGQRVIVQFGKNKIFWPYR